MSKYKIDLRFIEQAIRIRRDFLHSLKIANERQEVVMVYLDQLNKLKDDLDGIENKEDLILKIGEIEKSILVIEQEMNYHLKKREVLENDSKKLSEMVLDRYPGITEDEIKEQIYPYIKDLKI
jgi:hypothetical protein